jgi:hypothetical protein
MRSFPFAKLYSNTGILASEDRLFGRATRIVAGGLQQAQPRDQ